MNDATENTDDHDDLATRELTENSQTKSLLTDQRLITEGSVVLYQMQERFEQSPRLGDLQRQENESTLEDISAADRTFLAFDLLAAEQDVYDNISSKDLTETSEDRTTSKNSKDSEYINYSEAMFSSKS